MITDPLSPAVPLLWAIPQEQCPGTLPFQALMMGQKRSERKAHHPLLALTSALLAKLPAKMRSAALKTRLSAVGL